MKNILNAIICLFLFIISWGMAGAVSVSDNIQLQNGIESHLSDLRRAKAEFDAVKVNLAGAQKDMAAINGQPHTLGEYQALRDLIQKDQSNIETYLTEMVGDLDFLRNQWHSLTEGDKKFIQGVENSLGG